MMYDAKKNEIKTMVSITGPDGSIGTWLFDTSTSMVRSAIIELSRLIKNDYQGFTINSAECSRFVPESIKCIDADLAFVNPEWCIRNDSGLKVVKNEGLLARVCCECIRNAAYKDYIYAWASNTNNRTSDIIRNTITQAFTIITLTEESSVCDWHFDNGKLVEPNSDEDADSTDK